MNKWIILIYIVTVLMISGLAKAGSSVVLDEVSYDPNSLSIYLSGRLNNSCGANVSTSVIETQSTEDGPVLMIEISQRNPEKCISKIHGVSYFDQIIDIKSLGLHNNTNYTVVFNNLFRNNTSPEFKVSIPDSAVQQFFETQQYVGVLSKVSGNRYLLTTDNGIVYINSVMNLNKYLKSKVIIDGLEIIPLSGPGFDLTVQVPLRTPDQNQSNSVFVLGISTIN